MLGCIWKAMQLVIMFPPAGRPYSWIANGTSMRSKNIHLQASGSGGASERREANRGTGEFSRQEP